MRIGQLQTSSGLQHTRPQGRLYRRSQGVGGRSNSTFWGERVGAVESGWPRKLPVGKNASNCAAVVSRFLAISIVVVQDDQASRSFSGSVEGAKPT